MKENASRESADFAEDLMSEFISNQKQGTDAIRDALRKFANKTCPEATCREQIIKMLTALLLHETIEIESADESKKARFAGDFDLFSATLRDLAEGENLDWNELTQEAVALHDASPETKIARALNEFLS